MVTRKALKVEPDIEAAVVGNGVPVNGTNRRADIEAHLVKYGVSHTYRPDVPTSRIDYGRSLKNQARLGKPLDEATVKRYTEAMAEGDQFPPILVECVGGQYSVLDGNHRAAAAKAAGVSVDVYECEAKPQTLTLLTYLANTKHGLPSSEDDRIHHALFLIDSGVAITRAATQLQVPLADLKKAVERVASDRRADDAGIPRNEWEQLSSWARKRIAAVGTDEGMRAAAKLAVEAGLGMSEIEPMVRQLNETRNASRQVAAVKDLRVAYAERIGDTAAEGPRNGRGGRGGRGGSPRTRLAIVLGQAVALPPLASLDLGAWPESMREHMSERLDEALGRLTEIRKAMG